MKYKLQIILIAATCISMCSCRSHYAASSEKAYQESVNAMCTTMSYDGYKLASKSVEGGYYDKETYVFHSDDGKEVQLTYDVHRGEHNGDVFIDAVNLIGCSTSDIQDYDKYCGTESVPDNVLQHNLVKDTEGSKFSPGKTVAAVLIGSFVFGILLGMLQVAAAG